MNRAWIYVVITCVLELLWVFGFNVAHTWWHWALVILIILVDFLVLFVFFFFFFFLRYNRHCHDVSWKLAIFLQ